MPRIAEARQPAEPSSPEQKERYGRILRAAARHGAEKGLERMQMHDVAKDAGVAIATLYRYFPSKTHLFTSLMAVRVDQLSERMAQTPPGTPAAEAVAGLLVQAGRDLLARPLLAHAMVQSNNASVAQHGSAVTKVFADLILQMLGIDDPDEGQDRLVRITEAAWYGILISALNGHITTEQAEEDTRVACHRLLSDF
ncbi:MAG TPA: TetR family transcriptional regulator [Nocardioides sp.]|nr:TetR family transcriptional regulator [Nocardioides sp.]